MSDAWEGKTLPEVTLESSGGTPLKLPSEIKGQWSVLYYYPKDDTPGCTRQACTYRDEIQKFRDEGIHVYGVSADDLESHQAFIEKFSLNFPLLSDPKNELSGSLGVYGDQEWKGKVFKGLSRDSFLVDPEGVIRKAWRKVNPEQTISETLEAALELKNS